MSTTVSSPYETHTWSAPSAIPKLHSRAREAETACCAEFTFTKSLERIEIPQCIYDSRVGLGLLSKDPIGFAAGDANLYRMTGNHPNMATDPSGLFEKPNKQERKTEQGATSKYYGELSEHYKFSNPIASIYFGILAGPVALFDTVPRAIADSARWAREDIKETINTTKDPVQWGASYVAYPLTYGGEFLAQGGNGLGASAPAIIVGAEVPVVATLLSHPIVSYPLAGKATYDSIHAGIENTREGNFSGSDAAFIAMSASPFLIPRQRNRFSSTANDSPKVGIPESFAGELRGGGSWLMTEDQYIRYAKGAEMIGRTDGQFMTSARQMNSLIHEVRGNPVLLGERMSVSTWGQDTQLIRMDIIDPLKFNPRMPTSTMSGANSKFRPGGITSGGVPEIATDQLPWNQVWATPVRP